MESSSSRHWSSPTTGIRFRENYCKCCKCNCALTAELRMRPRHRIFWFLIFFPSLSIRKRKHIIFCSFVLFSWHFDYTSHGCMTVNLFGAYNIYNITFGNCDKDNSINCHDLLPLSGKKNLKINKKNTLPDQNPTVCVYIYIYIHLYGHTGNN